MRGGGGGGASCLFAGDGARTRDGDTAGDVYRVTNETPARPTCRPAPRARPWCPSRCARWWTRRRRRASLWGCGWAMRCRRGVTRTTFRLPVTSERATYILSPSAPATSAAARRWRCARPALPSAAAASRSDIVKRRTRSRRDACRERGFRRSLVRAAASGVRPQIVVRERDVESEGLGMSMVGFERRARLCGGRKVAGVAKRRDGSRRRQ